MELVVIVVGVVVLWVLVVVVWVGADVVRSIIVPVEAHVIVQVIPRIKSMLIQANSAIAFMRAAGSLEIIPPCHASGLSPYHSQSG